MAAANRVIWGLQQAHPADGGAPARGNRGKLGEMDLEAATWTIPAARRKDTRSKRRARAAPAADHVVPLSRQSVELLIAVRDTKHRTGKGNATWCSSALKVAGW